MMMAPRVFLFSQSLVMKGTLGPEEKVTCSLSEAKNASWDVKSKAEGCPLLNLHRNLVNRISES